MILKTLCGFSVAEIARAFLTNEETITKRLYRAREQFREQRVLFEIPGSDQLPERLNSVHTAIYLLFNEGYNSQSNNMVIREDLVEESLRLANLLTTHPATSHPNTFALLALLCFHAARLYGRVDSDNQLLTLRHQDRSKWNRELIEQGRRFQILATQPDALSTYHLEAAIAFEHCRAKNFESTDWKQILNYYDVLYSLKPTALVALNRAVVIAELNGPAAGLEALDAIPNISSLSNYYLLPAVRADFLARSGNAEKAKNDFKKAIELTSSPQEKELLRKKLEKLER